MNIKLSDDECSRWIAEHEEPHPTWNDRNYQHEIQISDGGYWWRPMADAIHDYETQEPRPRSVNDPVMTVLWIRQLLGGRDYECIISQDEIEMNWRPSAVKTGQSFLVSLIGTLLGRGVAETWMRMHGYKEQS